MRKSFIYIFIIGIFALLSACEKDETKVVQKSNPAGPALTNPGDIILLPADSADNLTFTWKPADFGFQAAVSYSLQLDLASNDFSDPITLSTIADTFASVNVYAFDNTLLANNYTIAATASKMRIMAILKGDNYADTVFSDPVSFNLTPFDIIINYSKLYFAGSWNSWTFNNTEYIISAKSDKKYEGYLYINAADYTFKMSLDYIGWGEATTIGDALSSGTSGTVQIGGWGGNNIYVDGDAGYYKFNVNLNETTYSIAKTDFAISGDFNSWGDTPMTYDIASGTWTLTTNLTAGGLKFKTVGSWDTNYGDTGADGKLDSGGTNVAVTSAGSYTITLNLSKYPYKYSLVKN
jgi:hypothetical protein